MSKSRITAFHGIFEERSKKLVKHIIQLRKDPTAKPKLKQLISEAKELKKLLKSEKPGISGHSLEVAYTIVDGKLQIDEISSPTKCDNIEIRCVGGLMVIEFDVTTKI